jgi:hypothetical protein
VVVVVVAGGCVVVVVAGAAVVEVGGLVVVVGALVVVVGALVVVVGCLVVVVVVARWCQARWLAGVAPEVLLTARELTSAAIAMATTTPPARVRRRCTGDAL